MIYKHNQKIILPNSSIDDKPPRFYNSRSERPSRGGIDYNLIPIKNGTSSSNKDELAFLSSLTDPIYQCPAPTPEPTPTNPYYATIPLITDIP